MSSFYYKGTTDPSFVNTSFYRTPINKIYVTNNYEYETFCDFSVTLHPSLLTWYPCGNELTYSISENTLIKGQGYMNSYQIDQYAPWNSKSSVIEFVELPELLNNIGSYAFYNQTKVTTISIPENVISIEMYAFMLCTSLESITIPERVTSIEVHSFSECSSLSSMIIPSQISIININTHLMDAKT